MLMAASNNTVSLPVVTQVTAWLAANPADPSCTVEGGVRLRQNGVVCAHRRRSQTVPSSSNSPGAHPQSALMGREGGEWMRFWY